MKIAKSQLKQIIKEEYSKLINEVSEKPGMIYAPEPGGGGDYAPAAPAERGDEKAVGRRGAVDFVDARVKFIERFATVTGNPFSTKHRTNYNNLIRINPPEGKVKHIKAFEAYTSDPTEQNLNAILNMFA